MTKQNTSHEGYQLLQHKVDSLKKGGSWRQDKTNSTFRSVPHGAHPRMPLLALPHSFIYTNSCPRLHSESASGPVVYSSSSNLGSKSLYMPSRTFDDVALAAFDEATYSTGGPSSIASTFSELLLHFSASTCSLVGRCLDQSLGRIE